MKKTFFLLGLTLVLITSCKDFFEGKPEPVSFFDFIRDNPDRASFMMSSNDTIFININSDTKSKLGNTVNLILAMEYARQASKGLINNQDTVNLTDFEVFNLYHKADPGYYKWKKSLESENRIIGDSSVLIRDAVKGMMKYGSMAITEYLGERLGMDNINAMAAGIGMSSHDPICPFPVSAYILFSNIEAFSTTDYQKQAISTSITDYSKICKNIHEELMKDKQGKIRSQFLASVHELDLESLEKWQPSATALEYHKLIYYISKRTNMTPLMQSRLEEVLEWNLDAHKPYYVHAGSVTGSSSTDLTGVLYATDVKGHRTEVVCFLRNLTLDERLKLQSMMYGFLMGCAEKSNRENVIRKLRTI